jgi:hypothetical protein
MKSNKFNFQLRNVRGWGRAAHRPDLALVHPQREWAIGVIVWLICTALGIAYAYFTFAQFSTITVERQVVEVEALRYDRAGAEAALSRFRERAATYEGIRATLPAPSPREEVATEPNSVPTEEFSEPALLLTEERALEDPSVDE